MCYGDVGFNPGGTISLLQGGISPTTTTMPGLGSGGAFFFATAFTTGIGSSFPVAPATENISATTTIYLIAGSNFGTSTQAAYGFIECRRM
jgi:hypothetical protein